MRIGSVLVPRSTSHESIGPRIAPAAFCTNFIHSTSSWCFRTTIPPTLSLWPLRNFVVLCVTMSAPSVERPLDIGAGERVVDDDADTVAMRDRARRGKIGDPQHRVGRRFDEQVFGLGRDRWLDELELRRIDVGEVEPELAADALEETERPTVGVVADDEMIADSSRVKHRVDRGHARGKGERGRAALDGREIGFERHPRRILRASVFETLVLAEPLLDVGGGLINRRDDGAGGRIGFLTGVNANGAESCGVVEFHSVTLLL